MPDNSPANTTAKAPLHPFRRAVLRGLGVVLPPLLTIVIFVWVGNTVAVYLLNPLEAIARWSLVTATADIRSDLPISDPSSGTAIVDESEVFWQAPDGRFVPLRVYSLVKASPGPDGMPRTAEGIYQRYVQLRYLKRYVVIPVFLCVFVLVLYLLGKFLAAGVGKFFWSQFERIIHRLPLIRNVYGSVKQVTDFMFSESEIEYTRVVAIEYPRRGIWTLAFVTGESMLDIASAANEPVLAVLVPTSPMPFTGFTITVKKSEAVDLNLTVDQALQFIVSCGVVVPPQQLRQALDERKQLQSQAVPVSNESSVGA
ncbi:MAG: DUF502 domain-containing protein [Planctomycetales bacterium]|nr:DUF502 domain-containing protein [Planctomycetales bacterium]